MKYTSKFKSLGFYVDGELKRFSHGVYNTTDKKEQSVLDKMKDVKKEQQKKASE